MVLKDGDKNSSLREKVFRTLRTAILEGQYAKGEVIREAAIAKALDVSRTPVREAIRQLELEGLVESIPNKETVVTGVSQEDVQDIFMIRSRLEGVAGRRAAERITEKELEELKEIIDLTEFYVSKEDMQHVEMLDHKFHEVIYKATKSKILNHVLSDFHSYVQRARMQSLETPGRSQKLLKEHTAIYEAIEHHNAEEAENLMHEHVHQVSENMHLS